MPFIKLNRINKGGDIVINSAHIMFVEIEGRSSTVHLTQNLLFSVEESPETVAALVEKAESARTRNAAVETGLGQATG
jgi:hypothetical protein